MFTKINKLPFSARKHFPRGLLQPPGSFRFSSDALLLAAFAQTCCTERVQAGHAERVQAPLHVLDIGTGCGVVGLAILCQSPQHRVWGIDILPELIDAARHNAEHLGLADAFTAICANCGDPQLFSGSDEYTESTALTGNCEYTVDIALSGNGGQTRASATTEGCEHTKSTAVDNGCKHPDNATGNDSASLPPSKKTTQSLSAGSFTLVCANPPYRERDKGRLPPSPSRLTALFEKKETLNTFCAAASRALHPEGRFAVIYPAAREEFLLQSLRDNRLAPVRILPLAPREGEAPTRILVEASPVPRGENVSGVQDASIQREATLFLHVGKEDGNGFTQSALEFCPFLRSCEGE